jgi:hypothetical protein
MHLRDRPRLRVRHSRCQLNAIYRLNAFRRRWFLARPERRPGFDARRFQRHARSGPRTVAGKGAQVRERRRGQEVVRLLRLCSQLAGGLPTQNASFPNSPPVSETDRSTIRSRGFVPFLFAAALRGGPVEEELRVQADRLVGGSDACWPRVRAATCRSRRWLPRA